MSYPEKIDLPAAARAVRKLLANGDDTTQVFIIMRAVNGKIQAKNFARLIRTEQGARQAYRQAELAEVFSAPDFLARFAPGTLGAAYRTFLQDTGYSALGLAAVSNLDNVPLIEHPHAWIDRRIRDIHDIWHVLTGYKADEHLGEASLVAFSYAQTGGRGWAVIAVAAALKSWSVTRSTAFARAVFEGYRHGRKAAWLLGEDYESMLHEPLPAVRARLRIDEPAIYRAAQTALGDQANLPVSSAPATRSASPTTSS